MLYNGDVFLKVSNLLTCRDPSRKDYLSIDYDLDSEEEWMEQNCDDLENDEKLMLEEEYEELAYSQDYPETILTANTWGPRKNAQ